MKYGVTGSGKYKNKKFVIEVLEFFVNKKHDIVVSGHSPRRRYYNVDIWAEDWANEFCKNEPIIYPPKTFDKDGFFERNKQIAEELSVLPEEPDTLLVFVNYRRYKSGAWNTVKHFIKKGGNLSDICIYDEFGKFWVYDDLPKWLKKEHEKGDVMF